MDTSEGQGSDKAMIKKAVDDIFKATNDLGMSWVDPLVEFFSQVSKDYANNDRAKGSKRFAEIAQMLKTADSLDENVDEAGSAGSFTTRSGMKFRRFTKEDWYGWAGAEKLPDGSEPFIATGYADMSGLDWAVIISGQSGSDPINVQFYITSEEDGEMTGHDKSFKTLDDAKKAVALLEVPDSILPHNNGMNKAGWDYDEY